MEKGPRTYPVQRRSEFMGNTNETRSTVRMVVIEEPENMIRYTNEKIEDPL